MVLKRKLRNSAGEENDKGSGSAVPASGDSAAAGGERRASKKSKPKVGPMRERQRDKQEQILLHRGSSDRTQQ